MTTAAAALYSVGIARSVTACMCMRARLSPLAQPRAMSGGEASHSPIAMHARTARPRRHELPLTVKLCGRADGNDAGFAGTGLILECRPVASGSFLTEDGMEFKVESTVVGGD
jgi:hypothetical protein